MIISTSNKSNKSFVNALAKGADITRRALTTLILIILLILFGLSYFYSYFTVKESNIVKLKNIEIIEYNKDKNVVTLAVEPDNLQDVCAVDLGKGLVFQEIYDGKCYITVNVGKYDVYFKDVTNKISNPVVVDNYLLDINVEDKYVMQLGTKLDFNNDVVAVGNPDIVYNINNDNVKIEDDKIIGLKEGESIISVESNGQVLKESKVVVANVLVDMPEHFDNKKPFLTCEVFSSDEAALLDRLLSEKVKEAGEGTRAGVVAAARFLTLSFPYRISYFWETGRVSNTGKHYADGEGRYYHKGLYLDKSKYKYIKTSRVGPAMWGCNMMNWESDPPNFAPGKKYPNGLDCSGFVSWSIYNGGFDIGDIGSYNLPTKGKSAAFTSSLINSDKIKPGDLFSTNGHIAILIGLDDNYFYVAESLNNYKGVVIKEYKKTQVTRAFSRVILMDDYYKEDGNLTNMWY